MIGAAEASPSGFCFCPQVLLEPVLAGIARARGGDLRPGSELTGLTPHDDRVTAVVETAATGRSAEIEADYVIAADGAGSPARQMLGISGWALPPTHHYLNVFVRADLTTRVEGRTFSQCEISNGTLRGLIVSKNNTDEWSFHIEYDPAREGLADFPEERCADLVRAATGVPGLDVTVLARSAWDTGVHVADQYRRGRVFIAGDAAHRHAPWGGFGANTGIADVHNLAWKLALVRAGQAGPSLLDTYQAERRPRAVVAGEQARLRTDFRARYGIRTPDNAATMDQQIDTGAIMTRYRYESPAVMPGRADSDRDWVDELTGQAGTRLPHLWLDPGGKQVSTLDLCGPGFALLAGADAGRWRTAAGKVRAETGLDVTVHDISTASGEAGWADQASLPADGALLIRPDQHVAARSDQGLDPDSLPGTLARLTGAAQGGYQ